MKASLVVLCSLLLASCGAGLRRFSSVARPTDTVTTVIAPDRDEEREVDAEDSPGEAAEFYLQRRTGGAPLPVEKLLEAKRHKDRMPVYSIGIRRPLPAHAGTSPRGLDVGTWQPLGPGNIGGRTRSFVIQPDNPNIMYAGAVGGGVWKTTDGGQTWNPLSDLLPSIAIATLAMDPKDPNILYAGTGEGFGNGDAIRGAGIFKTTDGGATWAQLPGTANNPFYYFVNKIVVSPNDSQKIYAATTYGVFGSFDGGGTWKLLLDQTANTQPGCYDLVIRTDQPTDYVFAACAFGNLAANALYRNKDAGGAGTWEKVLAVDHMARTTLALAPSQQGTIYAAVAAAQSGTCPTDNSTPPECYNNGLLGIWRSDSSGDAGSWNQQVSNQDSNFVNTVLFTNPRGAFADVCSGGASKKSWGNQGWYDNVIAVDPVNPEVVWVGGIDLFRSDDGGRNFGIAAFWELDPPKGSHADNHAIVFHPGYNGADNQTLYAASDGGIYRTDNALASTATGSNAGCSPYNTGVIWQNGNNNYAVTQFYHGSVYPGGGVYMGGSQDNDMERGSDATGPNAWTIPIFVGDGGYSAIDPTNVNTWFILGTRMSIRKTTNGGATSSTVTNGITEPSGNFQFIAPFVMDPANPKRLYTGGKTLWRTTDGAANWTAASSANPSNAGGITTIAVSPSDANHVAFGTSTGWVFTNTAALTTDNTAAWPGSQPRTGNVSWVAFDPADPTIVYVTYSTYNSNSSQNHVYRSADGGTTWTGIDGTGSTGLPNMPVHTIIVDPQNAATLYIGTEIGLFASTDGGATWMRDDNPFADAVTETLVLDRSAGQNTLFAFTHGRGVWKTVLPGSGPACQYSISSNAPSLPAYGGASAPIRVTTGDNCAWSVVSTNPSFTVSSPANGKGNGSFAVSVARNATAQQFSGQIVMQGQAIQVTQDPAQVASGNDSNSSPFPMGSLPSVVVQDTTSATESADDPVHSCTGSSDYKSVWFTLTSPIAGTMSLTYSDRRTDVFGDSGIALTIYPMVNGVRGAEIYCTVLAQNSPTAGVYHIGTHNWSVGAGATFMVEVSATTSGAPDGASIRSANLMLAANVN